jgi:hypothetical protein
LNSFCRYQTLFAGTRKPEPLNVRPQKCGDGICNIAQNEQCEADCATPGAIKVCMCTPATCATYHMKCPDGVCDIQRTILPEGEGCHCPESPENQCTTINTNCHVIESATECLLSDVDPIGPGLYRTKQCKNSDCRVTVPSVDRTAIPVEESK